MRDRSAAWVGLAWSALVAASGPGCALTHLSNHDGTDASTVDDRTTLDGAAPGDDATPDALDGAAEASADVVGDEAAAPNDASDASDVTDAADVPVLDASDGGADASDASDVVLPDAGVTYQTDPAHLATTGWQGRSSPGAQTQLHCGDGEVVTGVLMNADDYVNAFGLHCATLRLDGTLADDRVLARSGGSSGTDTDDVCPSGEVVVQAQGHADRVVDQWGGACEGIDARLAGGAPDAMLPARGGTGGNAFTQGCPAGTFLHGLNYDVYAYPNLWDHDRVWRVQLECIPILRRP